MIITICIQQNTISNKYKRLYDLTAWMKQAPSDTIWTWKFFFI